MADIFKYDPFSVGQNAAPNINDILNQQQLFSLKQQEQNFNTGQLALAQAKQQQALSRQQQLQGAVDAYWQKPSAEGLSKLIMNFPEAHEALSQGGDIADKEQKRQQFSQATGLFFKAQQDPGAAADELDTHTAADDAAGQPNDGTHAAISAMLRSGDPTQIERAKGLIFMNAYRLSDDQKGFLDAAKEYFPGAGGAGNNIHYWEGMAFKTGADGNPVMLGQGLPGTRVIQNPDGSRVVQPPIPGIPFITDKGIVPYEQIMGGGGTTTPTQPQPAPGAKGRKLVGGWTPQGENSASTITNKLGVMAKRSGFGIDQPLQSADIPKVFDALATTEGNPGAAHNNPGNIRDGPFARRQPGYTGNFGGFATFDSPANGRAAGITLMQNKLAAGHQTMRDIVAGRPPGRAQAHPAADEVRRQAQAAITAGKDPALVKARAKALGVEL